MTGIVLALAVGLFGAPTSQPMTPTPPPAKVPANNVMGETAVMHRGAPFTVKESTSLDDVAKNPVAFAGKVLKITGKVTTVCRKKGCWIKISGTTPAASARVTFKDYGFFAPFDAKGTMGIVEGTLSVKVMSQAEREHLADDAGKKVDEIPAAELRIVATGLEVRKVGH